MGCQRKKQELGIQNTLNDPITLIWYQIGEPQIDMNMVLEEVNKYTEEKIGVRIKIHQITYNEYSKRMQIIMNTGTYYDLAFTSSWANDYIVNAQKGEFLPLDDLLDCYGKQMYEHIDKKFWQAVTVGGKIYGVPNEKEIGNMPMWVFTKEYVDKYQIPYETIHDLEDLEPWLALIKENEPDVIPFYVSKDYSAPSYMDKIQDMIGIEYNDHTLTVVNLFETDQMKSTLQTMRRYYEAGYINQDAVIVTDDNNEKRFVTKADGQPYAHIIWSKNLGYEVVTSPIMDVWVTNGSARGAITAISRNSKYPEKAVQLLNLINTDEYLRNLLNYGIEGIHYEKLELSLEEQKVVSHAKENGLTGFYDLKIRLNPEKSINYSVPYWVQGGLFNTYVTEVEPIDKWYKFQMFNAQSQLSPSFGFDFNAEKVITEISSFRNIMDEFGAALYSGSVDPSIFLPKINEKLRLCGINTVIEEMQKQIDKWKE